jgi:hypothetical protein
MAKKLGREELLEWRRHFAAQAASGLTHERFCRERGLSLHAFRAWKYRMAGPSRLRSQERPEPQMKFVAVRMAPSQAAGPVEVVLGGGRLVRVGVGFDEATLVRVVRALEGTAC